jgi:hypothetical protein
MKNLFFDSWDGFGNERVGTDEIHALLRENGQAPVLSGIWRDRWYIN